MNLRPVELQIAVPRTTEASKLQQELQHRPELDQQGLAGQNIKESRELALRSTEVSESSESAVRDDGHRGGSAGNGPSQEQKKEKERNPEHPYKGHRFDIKL
ncbi:hypothetical protein SAMN04487895_101434 [Paenibacillus sophorae]|uniref:Uncharacterized protein n=1 Tax=Paenibacillus sophorae TaxID=1333845 RepID=A0A1H8G9S6_9BACL|nr:hypothetical protein [Paenibacillus sophorae]QWU14151.1 hypothetical protein KP014_19725 [Paenibacillus sophorae]SEN40723.1 hypothetical protein SAMN04487895_101434 [Paenibacillus sophorae]